MTQHDSVRAQLHAIEALLRQHQLWQETAPQPEAFASTQPFCLDTLAPFEWLQWVLIPRMHALLEGGTPCRRRLLSLPIMKWRSKRRTLRATSCWSNWKSWMPCLPVKMHDA